MSETKLGIDIFSGREIVVSDVLRQSGFYVIGKQGVGKSSFISHLINQDIVKGYPVIVLDPHGDLITDVISQMPDDAVARTYLLDLEDTDYPFSVNLFALSSEEAKDIKLRQKGIDRILRVCERLFPGESRMLLERVLRVIVQTLADNPGCSMGDIPALLYDEKYRSRLAKNTSRRAREYWEMEFAALPPSSRNREVKPLNNRISSLLDNPMLENIVAQKTTSIDFRKSIDKREIILIKLPVQEYSGIAPIIGTILIAEIYRSTFSFRDTQLEDRIGFSLFVDEFQNFSTKDFSELFTQGRKFGSRLLVAHQYREQLTDDNKSSTLTAPTIVSFNVTHPNARELSTSFVDQAARIREPVIYPDVLKRLSSHPSEKVQSFLMSYIEPMMHRSKEPLKVALPAYLSKFENYASLLTFLEKIMYLVQTDGFLTGENLSPAASVKDMFFDFERICSFLYGFSDYYAHRFYNRNPKREKLEVEAQKKLDLLNTSLEEMKQVIDNDRTFLALFVKRPSLSGFTGSWQKEKTLDYKRRSALKLLSDMLSFRSVKQVIAASELVGETIEEVQERLSIIAKENTQLRAYDTPEKICAIRKSRVEVALAEYEQKRFEALRTFCQMIGWRSSGSPIQYEDGRPVLQGGNNCIECVNKHIRGERLKDARRRSVAEDACRDVVRLDMTIYDYKKDPLRVHDMRGDLFEASSLEALVAFCKYLSTLDTPEKVLAAHIEEYENLNIAPLKNQIAQVQERLEADLAALDEQLEREKVVFDKFISSLWGCMAALSDNPIVEQKTLTPNDTTHILEHLDARHALVHTQRGENGDCSVFAIKTLDAPPRVEDLVFATRMRDIVDRTRKKYCRPRLEVEQELEAKKAASMDEDIDSDYGDDDFEGGSDLMRFDD